MTEGKQERAAAETAGRMPESKEESKQTEEPTKAEQQFGAMIGLLLIILLMIVEVVLHGCIMKGRMLPLIAIHGE